MSELLKPCPFCGKQPGMKIYGSAAMPVHAVECCNPSCPVNPVADSTVSESAAIQAWNTRAEQTCAWEHPQSVNGWVGYMVCSACGEKYDECVTDTARYCPNCGSKVVDR